MKRKITAALLISIVLFLFTGCETREEFTDAYISNTASQSSIYIPVSTSEAVTSVTETTTLSPSTTLEPTTQTQPQTVTASQEPVKTSIITNGGAVIELSSLEHYKDSEDVPTVYFIPQITPEAMMKAYYALNWTPTGKVAVKLSTGEPPASNYLSADLIKDVVQYVNGTIVECNTGYAGARSSTALHYQVAKDHGYTDIASVKILDEDGEISIPVTGGTQLKENFVGKAFPDYGSYLVLSHFKGHPMAGFGGAIKNISIGLASSQGKCLIHSSGGNRLVPLGIQDNFLESMGDAGKSVTDYLGHGERIAYINVMNNLSVDCDCVGIPAKPDMHDTGILASRDPVALDQACVDLIYVSEDRESLVKRIESRNGIHTLENAEKIGLGSRSYKLVSIDEVA